MTNDLSLYSEEPLAARTFRADYADALLALAAERRVASDRARSAWFTPQAATRDADIARYRREFEGHFGWPLSTESIPGSGSLTYDQVLGVDDLGTVRRLTIQTLGCLPVSGILLIPHKAQRAPLAICQHGGLGTPELVAGLYPSGTGNYSDFGRRLQRADCVVFLPQLGLWADNKEPIFPRQTLHAKLLHNAAGLPAIECAALRQVLDVLVTLPEIDPDRIGMAGLSYGGFYTLHTAALEPRIRSALVSCVVQDGKRLQFPDMHTPYAAPWFTFTEIGALICPRRLYIEHGRTDDVIDPLAHCSAEVAHDIGAWYQRLGAGNQCRWHLHEGWHAFDGADDGLNWFLDGFDAGPTCATT